MKFQKVLAGSVSACELIPLIQHIPLPCAHWTATNTHSLADVYIHGFCSQMPNFFAPRLRTSCPRRVDRSTRSSQRLEELDQVGQLMGQPPRSHAAKHSCSASSATAAAAACLCHPQPPRQWLPSVLHAHMHKEIGPKEEKDA